MMASLKDYKKLRGEFNRLFVNEENLLDENTSFLNLLAQPKDSTEALGLVKKLKDKGNSLFKQGEYDDALEKYGYAGVILAKYEFVEEVRDEFFKLAISILLNSSICLNKQKEFVQVGQICSIVLEFDPDNVKAMFRRAMAAIELGQLDWAKLDLMMAADIDPNNKEVLNKLAEIKNSLHKVNHKNQQEDVTPTGLGVGLPSPKKKVRESLEKENVMKQDECQEVKGAQNKTGDVNMEVDVNESMEEQKRIEGNEDVSNSRNSNLSESKYRFANRKRPGSFIYISRRDYQELMNGKSIKYFNSKLGSPMTIRAGLGSEDESKKQHVRQEVYKVNPTIGDIPKSTAEMSDIIMDSRDQKNEYIGRDNLINHKEETETSEVRYIITNSQQNQDSGIALPEFRFESCSSTTQDRRCITAARKRLKKARWKAQKDRKKQTTPATSTNPFVVCRYQVGMKRKLIYRQLESDQRPRKRLWFESCNIIESSTSVMLCSNASMKLQDSVGVNHEQASSLSNG